MPELIWDGKYDKDGRRVAPLRVALPLQTVETVNETAQQRQLSMDRFLSGRDGEWRLHLRCDELRSVICFASHPISAPTATPRKLPARR